MFSKRIINSGRFLKMPTSSQALYFHLGLSADDDGVVEAFQVMRIAGFAEDDLKVLAAKGLVKVLNEDLVTFILDWREHNLIRSDRKINSIYKNLLLQFVPESELIEPRKRADLKQSNESGRPLDNQLSTNGRLRVGEGRVGKENTISSNSVGQDISPTISNDLAAPEKMTEQDFEIFWENYPKKKAKKKAKAKFLKLNHILLPTLLSAVDVQKKQKQWQNVDFIPHADAWIHNDRWEDEIEVVSPEETLEQKYIAAARDALRIWDGDWDQAGFEFDKNGFPDSLNLWTRVSRLIGRKSWFD